MNCESVKNSLSLFLYGELSFGEEERVEQHLDQCQECREFFRKEQAIHNLIDAEEQDPPAGLLGSCRRDLRSRVREEAAISTASAPRTASGRFKRWLAGVLPSQSLLRPAGALALLALGFFGGRALPDRSALFPSPTSPSGPITSRVRHINPATGGHVQIVVDETRQRTLSGSPGDQPIQDLLLTAARDSSDPGLRVETMDILKAQCEKSEVRQALLHALQHDANAGVRLKALEGLKPYAEDAETRKVLSHVLLTDENPAVRTQAIDLLVQKKEQELVGTLQELLRKEDDNYVRLRSQRVLYEMKASAETF
jgi:hypothetical protein